MAKIKLERETKFALSLLSPLFLLIVVFIVFPLSYSFYLTFNEFSLRSLIPDFIGLGNYMATVRDPIFLTSLTQTLYFTFLNMMIGIPLGLGIALLLNEDFPGRIVARVCLLIPWAMPPIVTALMFQWMLNTSYGIVNYVLTTTGLVGKPITFFGNPSLALNSLILVNLWKTTPLYAIIFLSALQNIPSEVVESAKVYGAGTFRRFVSLTIPFLKPTIAMCSIVSALLSLQVFDIVISITQGGPGYRTHMLYFYAYRISFEWLDAGYGSTVAYIVTLIAVVLALFILRLRK